MDALLSLRLMEFLLRRGRGREHAVAKGEILGHLQTFSKDGTRLSDSAFCELYSALPVCVATEGVWKGMFLPRTVAEVEEYRRELLERLPPEIALQRYRTIIAYYPRLAPAQGEQGNIFGGDAS